VKEKHDESGGPTLDVWVATTGRTAFRVAISGAATHALISRYLLIPTVRPPLGED
jgi:hypothetical protein